MYCIKYSSCTARTEKSWRKRMAIMRYPIDGSLVITDSHTSRSFLIVEFQLSQVLDTVALFTKTVGDVSETKRSRYKKTRLF